MSDILNVGVDISLRSASVSFQDQDGTFLGKTFQVGNNPSGFETLEQKIRALTSSLEFKEIRIGLEATGLYGFHLSDYFSRTSLGCVTRIFLVNAKYISRFKKAFPEKEKTDLVDAQVITEYLRFGKLPVEYRPEALHLPIQRLVRYRYRLVKTLEREKKFFLSNLFLLFPGWVQERPIKGFGASSMAVLNELSLDEIAAMPLEDLALFVAKAGKNRSPDPQALAEKIQQAARESHRIRPQLAGCCKFVLASTTRTIAALNKSLKEVNQAIAEEGGGFLNPLLSVKGIGPVYAAGILACIGDVKRFASDDKLAKMAGLAWKRNQSGEFEAAEKRLVRECDKYLRYYLVETANSLRVHNEEYRLYYQKKYQEVTCHQHKRALVLSARKLVRLVFALLTKNRLYVPDLASQSARPSS
jgi:transposase